MARIEIEKEEGDTTSLNAGEEAWGTLEELLLACAVNRHGTKSWDSIAKEVQNRSLKNRNNDNSFLNAFTPQNCKQKYLDLRRWFSLNRCGGDGGVTVIDGDDGGGGGGGGGDGGGDDEVDDVRDELLCMVDELRKLRVEELKRQVQRHDVSIVSLQSKVKRLEEERERSMKVEAEGAADLATGTGDKHREPDRSPPAKADGETASGGGSDQADRSFNESNSTNHKGENRSAASAGENRESKGEPVENRGGEPEPGGAEVKSEPAKSSFTDGSGRLRNGDNGRGLGLETSRLNRLSEPVELKESVSYSKRDVRESTKHSSDVQSSASLSRRKRRCWRGGGSGGSSGDELETEEQSPANKRITVKSQPLIRFMEIIRSHKHGSVFERRLPSQKTEKYQNLIRQHMDLEKVQSKLDKGIYSDYHLKFYRDLLLIFTNAILFYRKSSAEHLAARELRKLVTQEIVQRTQKSKPHSFKHEPQPHLLEPLVKKPRSATTMIMCRRHSSTSVKQPSAESMNKKVEGERVENGRELEEKPKPELKKAASSTTRDNFSNGHASKGDQKGVQKKLTREISALGNRSSENSKNNNNSNNKKKKGTEREVDSKEDSSDNSDDEEELVMSKKEKQKKAVPARKKQGVVNFLKRMKQNSPAREGAAGNGGEEDEKREKGKDDKKKGKRTQNGRENNEVLRRTSGRREGRDVKREVDKRAVGRPPRRKAAMSVTESVAVKRKRERSEKEAGGSGRPKKKSRR